MSYLKAVGEAISLARATSMASTLGGDDPLHDIPPDEKDEAEKRLREDGKRLRRQGKPKEAKKKYDRANEISREKSKRAHQD